MSKCEIHEGAGKLGTVICKMALFDWIMMLVRLKVMFK